MDFSQNFYSKNDQNIVGRGPPKEISGESTIFGLKWSKIFFCSGDPLIEDFWPFFAEVSKFAEISKDLIFNYSEKYYLSEYRRNEGSAALEIFFEE